MEDIYDDLTNYEDVNALEELRTENKELKEVLDKRSAAMEKLQKDYDTLEAEFKKLEHNYSSLLMTARAEIERKTQRINQLNTEKDMMVLNALKSGQRIRRNFSKNQTKYEVLPGKGNNNKNKENIVKQKQDDIKQERREMPVLPPKDMVPETGASNKNKSDNAGTKVELSSTKKSNVNENIAQPKTDLNEPSKASASSIKDKSDNAGTKVELSSTKKSNVNENIAQPKTDLSEPPKASASSIKDRRKSMPAVSMPIDTISSDDELERNYQTKDTRTEHIQNDNERRNTNKTPINKNSNKTSEISSADDRVHNYHDPVSRDNYKGRPSRQQDTSSYRSRDKYEVSLKYRKQYSPERGQKRQHREHQDDYHRYERERYKGRSLESPPPESYSRYNRRKSEYRSDYDRYSHDYEKMRHLYDDRYSSSKYRSKDYDEPHAKRQRTELYSNPNVHSKEDKRHRNEREPVDGQPVPCFSPHEYDMLRYSCQSPDFVYSDAGHTKPIKEIMATATVPLEDPRTTSKKYVIWKDNGKETLSTVVGRNIDIIPVNKSVFWNFTPVDVPAALVRRPSQCSDQLVKDIYMDIDNPVPNLDFSIESGEVRETDEEIHEIRSKPKEIKHDSHDFKISKQVTNDLSKQPIDLNIVPLTNIAGSRIPKVWQNKKNTNRDVPIIDLDDNLPHHKNANRKNVTEDSFSRELLTHKQQYNEREKEQNLKSREAADNLQSELTTHKQKYNEREERVNVEDSLHSSKNYVQKERIKNVKSSHAEKELSTRQYNEGDERGQVEDSHLNDNKYNQMEHTKKSRSRETEDSLRKELSTENLKERMHVKDSIPNNKKYSKLESNKTSTSKEREDSFRKELSTHKQQYDEREERVNVRDSVPDNKKYSKLETNKTSTSKEREDSFRKELSTHKQQYDEREEHVNVTDFVPDNNKKYSKLETNKTSTSKEREDSFRKELSTHKQQYDERKERVNVRDSVPNNKKHSKLESNKTSTSKDRDDSFRKELSTHEQHYDKREERVNVKDSLPNNKKYSKLETNKTSTSKEREDSYRKELSTHKKQYEEREERVNVKDSDPNNEKYSKKETNKKLSSTEPNANQNQSTLTKIAIVADDLELSDDNSDYMDANRTAPTKLHKNCEKPINMNETKINDSGNISDDKTLTGSHNTEIERTVDTAKITGSTEKEKCKESDSNKKQKTKRKKSKSISKDLVDSGADAILVPEKKSRSKKERESTPQETKEKFSDLFGDSSSLMTPEDLGIPTYLPISEDAQDAVDIKINEIIDGSPLNYRNEIPKDIHIQNRIEIKIQETAHDDIPKAVLQKSKTDVDQKEVVTEIKKKSSKKNKENVIEPSQLPSPIVYENLNPGTDLNDPNVVKTVIISTGKQPEIAYENSVDVTKSAASVVVNSVEGTKDHLFPARKEYKADLLKALATSTPHKEFSAVNALLPNAANTDAISDPCVSKAVASITGSEKVVNQTETKTESDDVPDVRIFVKRRRKAVKPPAMT